MRFAVVDLETANSRMHSICQIGIVVFDNGREVASDVRLINPGQHFDPINISIHGIDQDAVADALLFADVYPTITRALRDEVVVCHTHFDRVALEQACDHHSVERMSCRWLDSARVARRAWPQFAKSGYGLANLANEFNIPLQHHDALEDARAAGLVLLKAIEDTGIALPDWFDRLELGLAGHKGQEGLRRTGDGDGPLLGECLAFTGTFSRPKAALADLAHSAGAAVEPRVTKKVTMLVVGEQDAVRVGASGKSSNHLKAEEMKSRGVPILIIAEPDFLALVAD